MELQKFYDSSAWRALRKLKLQRNPMCEICFAYGRLTEATIVDHIVAVRDSYEGRLDIENLQSVCLSCHSRKTRQEEKSVKRLKTSRKSGNSDNKTAHRGVLKSVGIGSESVKASTHTKPQNQKSKRNREKVRKTGL
jgi:5-methylcytosine-specific restriction endonuclease McrA